MKSLIFVTKYCLYYYLTFSLPN